MEAAIDRIARDKLKVALVHLQSLEEIEYVLKKCVLVLCSTLKFDSFIRFDFLDCKEHAGRVRAFLYHDAPKPASIEQLLASWVKVRTTQFEYKMIY